jgi:hypothetical protein
LAALVVPEEPGTMLRVVSFDFFLSTATGIIEAITSFVLYKNQK